MEARIAALVLYIAASVFSEEPPHTCSAITRQNIPLLQKLRCSVIVQEGHLNALCNIVAHWPHVGYPGDDFRGEGYNVLLLNLQLVSDNPVVNMTLKDEPTCLSLRNIWVRKRENYKGDFENYLTVNTDEGNLGPFQAKPFFDHIRLMTFNITFRKSPQVAAVICNETSPERVCLFDVYGFMPTNADSSSPDLLPLPLPIKELTVFFYQFNFGSSLIDTLNVTLEGQPETFPGDLKIFFTLLTVKHFICYRCRFRRIGYGGFLVNRDIEHFSFFGTPIEEVAPFTFDGMQRIKHVSLKDTRLPGIPKAIFRLPKLETFEMSHTDTFNEGNFDYSPANRSRNSNATRLVLSGSKLIALPNRAFCAFPMLEELALDSCNLRDISGSPFECLQRLKNLYISGNNIMYLYDKNVKGLGSLVNLDVSNNGISNFQGSHILLTLVSLRTLSLAHNTLGKLDLYSQSKTMIEELNIEGNHVKLWEPPVFSRMLNLKKLSFARNEFTQLDAQMLHDIRHVDNVDFGWNQWDCFTCDLNNLQTLLQKHPPKCSNCFSCATPLELYGQNVRNVHWREDDCGPPDYYRVYVVPSLLSLMVATLLVNVAYRKRWYIMYGLLYLKVAIKGYRRQRNVGSFLWDGFLSYHASDADWVRDVLLQRLESPPMEFRLCVAERDFIPGLETTENICRAIAQSRTSLFVISREFCRSRWCMFELSLAQHRLFESDRQHGMVFIKKNDVDESDMSTLLQYLTMTRTYVQIPPDGSSETLKNLFWLQLQAALEK